MADYFTHFSLIVPLPSADAQTYALDLAGQAARAHQGDQLSDNFPKNLAGVIEDWNFETEADQAPGKPGLWLHTSSGGVDAACAFIQHLLDKFDPTGRVTFEWSNDCSRPRVVGAYGGGAVIITARKIKSMTTIQWLRKHAA
jgi:hypothetical protein